MGTREIYYADRDSISNGTMDCWGQSTRIVTGVTGRRIQNSAQPVRLDAGGSLRTACQDRDAGEPMCDSPGQNSYRAHWNGLFETPLPLESPPPCGTLCGTIVTFPGRRFADGRAVLRIGERAGFSVGYGQLK